MALIGNFMAQVKSGDFKVLVVFGERRDPALPNVPTLIGGQLHSQPWTGHGRPQRIPPERRRDEQDRERDPRDKANVDRLAGLGMTAARRPMS
jgi:hypothetical protein